MTALETFSHALAQGGKILWDRPGGIRVMVPKALRERLEVERETIREVLRRAAVFREQAARFILEGQLLPVLALPERPEGNGCWSCGAPLQSRRYRCEVCALAVTLALEGMP